jgi:Cytochrome c7 and related cytochrome c
MSQVFSRDQVFALKVGALAAVGLLVIPVLVWGIAVARVAPRNEPIEQPVPFSHKHHVGDVGIDCRYCHTSVEESAFAGMPPTETCMTCHSQLFTGQPMLAPVVQGFARDRPIRWKRVNELPDFVFFNHSIHVHKGVGCVSCHGRLDRMPLTRRVAPLTMQWCLACHRNPVPHLRPREHVFDMDWQPGPDTPGGAVLMARYGVQLDRLTDCSVCHR